MSRPTIIKLLEKQYPKGIKEKKIPIPQEIVKYIPIQFKMVDALSYSEYDLALTYHVNKCDKSFNELFRRYEPYTNKFAYQIFSDPMVQLKLQMAYEDIFMELSLKFRLALAFAVKGLYKGISAKENFRIAGSLVLYYKSWYNRNLREKMKRKGRDKIAGYGSIFTEENPLQTNLTKKEYKDVLVIDEIANKFIQSLDGLDQKLFNNLIENANELSRSDLEKVSILKRKFVSFSKKYQEK
jgi:hypothetical protein